MFITGPAVIKKMLATVTMEELGGAEIRSEISGVADLVVKSDQECLTTIAAAQFLASQLESLPPRKSTSDLPDRSLDSLNQIVPDDMRRAYNILQVIKAIVDDNDFFELKPKSRAIW